MIITFKKRKHLYAQLRGQQNGKKNKMISLHMLYNHFVSLYVIEGKISHVNTFRHYDGDDHKEKYHSYPNKEVRVFAELALSNYQDFLMNGRIISTQIITSQGRTPFHYQYRNKSILYHYGINYKIKEQQAYDEDRKDIAPKAKMVRGVWQLPYTVSSSSLPVIRKMMMNKPKKQKPVQPSSPESSVSLFDFKSSSSELTSGTSGSVGSGSASTPSRSGSQFAFTSTSFVESTSSNPGTPSSTETTLIANQLLKSF